MQIDWELLAAAVILILFGVTIWRGGARNPTGTGRVYQDMKAHDRRIQSVEERLGHAASSQELAVLREEVRALKGSTATSVELETVEGKLAVVEEKVDGLRRLGERTENTVQRIESILVKKALEG